MAAGGRAACRQFGECDDETGTGSRAGAGEEKEGGDADAGGPPLIDPPDEVPEPALPAEEKSALERPNPRSAKALAAGPSWIGERSMT